MLFGILSKQSLLSALRNFIFTYTLDSFVKTSGRPLGNVVNGLSKSVLEEKCSILIILSNTKKK